MKRQQAQFIVDNIEMVKAFANGEIIECKVHDEDWHEVDDPAFLPFVKYRVKPTPIKVTYRKYLWKSNDNMYFIANFIEGQALSEKELEDNEFFVKWLGETITEEVEI